MSEDTSIESIVTQVLKPYAYTAMTRDALVKTRSQIAFDKGRLRRLEAYNAEHSSCYFSKPRRRERQLRRKIANDRIAAIHFEGEIHQDEERFRESLPWIVYQTLRHSYEYAALNTVRSAATVASEAAQMYLDNLSAQLNVLGTDDHTVVGTDDHTIYACDPEEFNKLSAAWNDKLQIALAQSARSKYEAQFIQSIADAAKANRGLLCKFQEGTATLADVTSCRDQNQRMQELMQDIIGTVTREQAAMQYDVESRVLHIISGDTSSLPEPAYDR